MHSSIIYKSSVLCGLQVCACMLLPMHSSIIYKSSVLCGLQVCTCMLLPVHSSIIYKSSVLRGLQVYSLGHGHNCVLCVWMVNWISGVILLTVVYWTIPLSDLLHLYYILHTTFRRALFTTDWITGTMSESIAARIPTLSLIRLPPNSKVFPHCVVYFSHTERMDSKLSFKLLRG